MIRWFGIILGLALAAASYAALTVLDPDAQPEVRAQQLIDQGTDPGQTVALYTEAVRRDPANAFRWADLGEAFVSSKDIPKARAAYARALELSRDIPQIWLRIANFHFQLNEPIEALDTASRVLKTVPDYDSVLFNYFAQFAIPTETILKQIGTDRRATRDYAKFLMDRDVPADAITAWKFTSTAGFNDAALTASYIDALLRGHRYDQAQRDWATYLGKDRDGYPDRNLIFNGGFELVPSGAVFDWRILPSGDVETVRDPAAHDGHWALRIKFPGNANISYANATQITRVQPGSYLLRAWVRTEGITTNEGPRIEIADPESAARLDILSEPFSGTRDWTLFEERFSTPPGTNLIAVRIVRQMSQKFDNKIAGTLWIDSVQLLRN